MNRLILAPLAAAILLLAGPQVAEGHGRHGCNDGGCRRTRAVGFLDPLSVALADARTYWGAEPACSFTVTYTAELPAGFEGAGMWVSFETPLGHDDFAAPYTSFTQCGIFLYTEAKTLSGTWLWSPYSEGLYNWPQFCQSIIHEYGHLLGHPDEDQSSPTSVMYGRYTRINEPWSCGKPPWEDREDVGWGKTLER